MKRLATLSAIVTGCALFANAHAQDMSPALQKIRDTGVISLGIGESSVPFSYYDSQQHTIGYSQEIALRIVDEVKKELKLSKLTVKETPITSQNRIPVLQNGTIDIECGSTTHTKERANQVAFTNSFFQYGFASSRRRTRASRISRTSQARRWSPRQVPRKTVCCVR